MVDGVFPAAVDNLYIPIVELIVLDPVHNRINSVEIKIKPKPR